MLTTAPARRRATAGRWLLGFYFLGNTAESAQAVAILWSTYLLTHNALAVGAINAAAYLPGVALGLVLRKKGDSGSATAVLSVTNWVLFTGSALLALVWAAGIGTGPVLAAFVTVQCSLSVMKMFNKSSVSRFVRNRFPPSRAAVLLSRATSLAVIGVMAGGGAAGVLLDSGSADACFGVAALFYLLSLVAVRLAIASPARSPEPGAGPGPEQSRRPGKSTRPRPERAPWALRMVLLYSVPSSGALSFITTLMVPLAQTVAPGSGVFYSVLVIMAAIGGFLAGALLSGGRVRPSWILGVSLPLGGALLACFSAVRWLPAVAGLMLAGSIVVTAHVMVMQVLTNQAPPEGRVGQFSMVRNAVAGSAKAGFSLLAGLLADSAGLDTGWLVLALVLAVFGVAWRWAPDRVAIGEMVHVR